MAMCSDIRDKIEGDIRFCINIRFSPAEPEPLLAQAPKRARRKAFRRNMRIGKKAVAHILLIHIKEARCLR